jgi:hypothetical protein
VTVPRRIAAILVLSAAIAVAGEAKWPEAIPELKLNDPLGRSFSHLELGARGAVIVVTAPCLSQGDAQFAWDDAFKKAKPAVEGPAIAMLEDMSQSWFRPAVLARMKESYNKTARVLLLLDESGATRKSFGVPENATIAFAFNAEGKLVHVEKGAGTVERVQRLLKAAAGL